MATQSIKDILAAKQKTEAQTQDDGSSQPAFAEKSIAKGLYKSERYQACGHHYNFKVKNKTLKPDAEGFYYPQTLEEKKAFEHFLSKGFVSVVEE